MMTSTERRITQLEKAAGAGSMVEYRRTVMCLLEIGAIEVPEDINALIQQYAAEGWTLKAILDEIDGTSRGLPGPHEEATYQF
ncbi:MAG: hypothetical protein RBS57_11595 [Desulforhabdus sp.]|jgi:hypothetical protein|nr:hypothetical protein [Desulforhabdus sp.]